MKFDRGVGRTLKILLAAVLTDKLLGGFSSALLRFVLVFVAVFVGDNIRIRTKADNVLYVEDIVAGGLKYAGLGLLCWWLDFGLSLYTGRHAGPVLPAVLFAVLDKAWFSTRSFSRTR